MKSILFCIASVLILGSCSKDVEDLPDPSNTGENTFGAKVNGKLWVPQGFGVVPTGPLLSASFTGNNSIIIIANDFSKQPNETEFEIYLKEVTSMGAGTYQLNQNTSRHPGGAVASYAYYVERRFQPLNEWITSAQQTGSVVITKWDPVTKILSGSFQFQAANTSNSSDILTVTEGRFDVIVQ